MAKNSSLKKRIFAAIIAGTMVMSLSLTGCNNNGTDQSSKTSQTSENSKTSVESKFGDNIAVKSENYKISLPIMTYLYNYNYQSYLSYYGTYMSYYGFDSSKSPKEQYYDESNQQTWYDYFMSMTKDYIQQTLVLAEAAKADGIELDDADLENIKTSMTQLESNASEKNMTADEYVAEFYGDGVSQKDIEECLKLTALAQKYYNKVYDGFKYTDDDYEKYYQNNKTSYQYADFLKYTFTVPADTTSSSDSSETSESSEHKEASEKAKAYAEALSQCKTEDEFKDYVKKYLEKNPDLVTSNSSSTSESSEESKMTDEEIQTAIDTAVKGTLSKKYSYEVTSDIGKWIFDDSRKSLDTTVVENSDGSYTAVMLLKPAYRDESVLKNVRHILLSADTYGSDDAAKAKADEVYKEWQGGDATEDSFGELANKYSSDGGSNSKGGLYENVTEGQMVEEFDDWCFDSSRKPGDTGIVKTQFGYHIMYFVGDSGTAWKMSVDSAMRSSDFNDKYNSLKEDYKVEYDDDYLNTIEVKTESEESSTESTTQSSAESKADTSSKSE